MEKQIKIPANNDIEEAVLGFIINSPGEIATALDLLSPDDFLNPNHKALWESMVHLNDSPQGLDLITLSDYCAKQNNIITEHNIPYYVTNLSGKVGYVDLSKYCRLLNEYRIRREMLKLGNQMIGNANDHTTDTFTLYDDNLTKMYSISDNLQQETEVTSMRESVLDAINRLDHINKSGELLGVTSGFSDIDSYTNGWGNSDLIILAARPSMGKTSLALSFAINAAVSGKGVYLLSLEMNKLQLTQRMLSIFTELPLNAIRNGDLQPSDYDTLMSKGGQLSELPITIDDSADTTITKLRSRLKKHRIKNPLDVVIVDYLQLITQDAKSREQEVSKISRGLKLIAKELDVPVIALAQLSRRVEDRSDKKPMLSDLRDSGSIEQDADIVSFIWRPEYYGILEAEDGTDLTGLAKFMIAKNRNGRVENEKINLNFDSSKTKFKELNSSPF